MQRRAERKTMARPTWKQKLALLAGSLAFLALGLAAAEAFCWLFLDVTLHGNSKELFIGNAFRTSRGNAKNIEAVSFGVEVHTDGHGFRIDPTWAEPRRDSAVLILGDSVAFGAGVPEAQTFAGRLRRRLSDVTVYNSSSIGYAISNYKDVVDVFVPQHEEIEQVYLFFCLNDLSDVSAALIEQSLDTPRPHVVERMKSIAIVSQLNDWLRERSKLYLFAVGVLTDPSRRNAVVDLGLYDLDDGAFDRTLQPIVDIDRGLRSRGIGFTVLLLPYEMQLRTGDSFLPQQKLARYLSRHGVAFVDLTDRFRELPAPRKAFLFADPMHFSTLGHEIVFDALWEAWQARTPGGAGPQAAAPSPQPVAAACLAAVLARRAGRGRVHDARRAVGLEAREGLVGGLVQRGYEVEEHAA